MVSFGSHNIFKVAYLMSLLSMGLLKKFLLIAFPPSVYEPDFASVYLVFLKTEHFKYNIATPEITVPFPTSLLLFFVV